MRDRSVPLDVHRLGELDYVQAWDLQKQTATARADRTGPDTLLLLTHPAVYTAGKRTQPEDRPVDGTPVVDVDRGGRITWHGPGQLVGYPLIELLVPIDVVAYVRALEQALIAVCDDVGLAGTGRVDGRSGVWLPADDRGPERKVAAIGVRVTRGVTMHGFALNCDPDLTAFDRIVPCGLTDVGVTSLTAELDRPVRVADVLDLTEQRMRQALDGLLPITDRDLHRSPAPAGVTWHLDTALAR